MSDHSTRQPSPRATRASRSRTAAIPAIPLASRPNKQHRTSSRNQKVANSPDDEGASKVKPPPPDCHQPKIPQADLTVHNYQPQKVHWTKRQLEEQLADLAVDNRASPSPLVIAEAIAQWKDFEHTLDMLAMIGKTSVMRLKTEM